MPAPHLDLGLLGEEKACNYLLQKGFSILDRNWRCRCGELDIVGRSDGFLVFVEVKTRRIGARGTAADTLSRAKMNRLYKSASLYLSRFDLWAEQSRFDLIHVIARQEKFEIEHYKDVIRPGQTSGRGYSYWQPW